MGRLMKKGAVVEGIRRLRGRDRLASVWSNGRQATPKATAWDQSFLRISHLSHRCSSRHHPRSVVRACPCRAGAFLGTSWGLCWHLVAVRFWGLQLHVPISAYIVLSYHLSPPLYEARRPLARAQARTGLSTICNGFTRTRRGNMAKAPSGTAS